MPQLLNAAPFPNRFSLFLFPQSSSKAPIFPNLGHSSSSAMGSEGFARRPFCNRCSKPARICLCVRLKSPPLNNSIAITILQHTLEKSHPLNSSRIASIALTNLRLIPITDVLFQAHFLIRPLHPNHPHASPVSDQRLDLSSSRSVFCAESEERFDLSSDGVTSGFCKYDVTYSSEYIRVAMERTAKPDIGWILNHPVGRSVVSNGFMVRKLQRKKLFGRGEEFADFEEFDLVIPPGTVLLFPSSDAVEVGELGCEVKHLIVLDGTWAKARRMYYENPWLKLLPHLKLDQRKESLYSEVRHQPKAGYLSTVESIVYALKGLGNDMEGLDDVLRVFESMIKDQRRCKDEKFKAMSESCVMDGGD